MSTFLSRLQWPTVVLLVAVIAAVVVAAALGVDREAIAIVGAVGSLLTAFAPAIGKRDADVLVLLLAIGLGPLLVSGCGGTASRVSTATACGGLMLAVSERADYAPERAVADIESVAAVCRRLDVDAGAP